MKKMNVVGFVMLMSLLLLSQVLAEFSSSSNAESSSVSQTNDENQMAAFKRTYHRPRLHCGYACARRCRETSRKKVCYRACGSCCAKCQCVPPGTSGNTAACPCYANIRTHGNKLKCP